MREHRWRLLTEGKTAAELNETMETLVEVDGEVTALRDAYARAALGTEEH
jgi:hypothetical protein